MVDPIGICEKHQLPLDRNGECELCRLSEMPSKAPAARSAWWALIIPLLIIVAGVAWAFSTYGPDPEAAPEQGVRTPAPEPAGVAPTGAETPTPEPEPPPPPEPERPEPPAPDYIPRPEDFEKPEPSPEGTLQEIAPPKPSPPGETHRPEWKMDLARRRVMVTMYATKWCGVCRKARAYMAQKHIDFTELDTDASPAANRRLRELNPSRTVPTFQLDELVYVGFREESFEAKLNQAARKYL